MCVCVCGVCVCVCVCVWGVKDHKEFWNKCEKGKGKEGEAFVGVSNEQPLDICAWVGVATMLAFARVTHHGTYLQSLYGM